MTDPVLELLHELRPADAAHVDQIFTTSQRDATLEGILRARSVPVATSPRARRRRVARSHPRRTLPTSRRGVLVPAVAILAAAAVVIFAVLPGGPAAAPASAAAAVLDRAAVAAQDDPAITLGSGEYLYSEIRTLAGSYWQWGATSRSAYTVQPETVQTWVASDGSDRRLTTYDGPQQFSTAAGREAWVLAGQPSIAPLTNTPSGQYDTEDGPGGFSAPDDLSQLPTDPEALTELIDTGRTGLDEIDFPFTSAHPLTPELTPAYTFNTAAEILATPAVGSSAALRTALYQVMANVQGIELLGPTTDHSGRSGTEVAGPLGGGIGAGVPYGANGVRVEVIIDPTSGELLEISDVIANPSLDNAQTQSIYGNAAGQVLTWTDYLASGTVSSTTATPSESAGTPTTGSGGAAETTTSPTTGAAQ